jgi:hypothetical protein
MPAGAEFPGGKCFAFTIFDDTDVATVENIRPIYLLLEDLGMRTTKTSGRFGAPREARISRAPRRWKTRTIARS